MLTRMVAIVISRDGQRLARLDVLYRLCVLGGSLTRTSIRVGVGGRIITGKIIWVLILAAHDGVRRRRDREVSSGAIEVGHLSMYSKGEAGFEGIIPRVALRSNQSHQTPTDSQNFCQVSGGHGAPRLS